MVSTKIRVDQGEMGRRWGAAQAGGGDPGARGLWAAMGDKKWDLLSGRCGEREREG